MDECQAQGGTCNTWFLACDPGYDTLGTCGSLVKTGCCKKSAAQTYVGSGAEAIKQDLCNKNPSAPECQAGQAQNATAGGGSAGSAITLSNPLCPTGQSSCITINGIIGRFISMFLGFVGAIALLVFVYAGIMYMTGGSSDRVKKAIETMKYAALGLIVIMFAYVITNFYFTALTSNVPKAAAPKNIATPH